MKWIKKFEEIDSTELLQKKLKSKEAIKKFKQAKVSPAWDKDFDKPKLKTFNPLKWTDVPLDVYLQRSKQGIEDKPKKDIQEIKRRRKEEKDELDKFKREEEELIQKEEKERFIKRLYEKMKKIEEVEYLEDIDDSVGLFGSLGPHFDNDMSLDYKLIKKNLKKGLISEDKYKEMMSHFYVNNKLKTRYNYGGLFDKGYPMPLKEYGRIQLDEIYDLYRNYSDKNYILRKRVRGEILESDLETCIKKWKEIK